MFGAQNVLKRWQSQHFSGDFDLYFLNMSKKYNKLYPYSVFVLYKVFLFPSYILLESPDYLTLLPQVET